MFASDDFREVPRTYSPPPRLQSASRLELGYVTQPNQDWYYCDNPRGYYLYVCCIALERLAPRPGLTQRGVAAPAIVR